MNAKVSKRHICWVRRPKDSKSIPLHLTGSASDEVGLESDDGFYAAVFFEYARTQQDVDDVICPTLAALDRRFGFNSMSCVSLI